MRKTAGFSLLELLLTIAIVLGLAGAAAGFYTQFLVRNAVSNASDQLVQSLRKAQFYALESYRSNTGGWGVYWDNGSHTLSLYQGVDYAHKTFTEDFIISPSVSLAGITEISFSRVNGVPSAGAPATITVSGLGSSRTISLNGQGVVSP